MPARSSSTLPSPRFRKILLPILLSSMLACSDEPPTGENAEALPSLPAPSNILLITVDTLRADHLSAYGYPRQTSPTLDRLAAEGVRFDRPAVQWPKTGPSFASMMTSTHPSNNGIVRRVGIEVPCSFRMLAEHLKEQGYGTHAVVANGALAAELRYDQGFDSYIETWKHKDSEEDDPNGAAAVNRLAKSLIDKIDREKPFFMWIHYLDPHFPYTPPAPFTDKFQNDEHFDPSVHFEISDNANQQVVKVGYSKTLEDRTDLAFYEARYDAEIAYTDHQIDVLLQEFRGRGLMEETLTVFTSDHGESLGEHNFYFDHGRFPFQTCLRVPLIFHYPGVLKPGVVKEPVELVDLGPTLLQAAGVELEDGRHMQGRTLLPQLRGIAEPDPRVFSEAGVEVKGNWQRIAQDQRFKLVFARSGKAQAFLGGRGVPFTLYDLESDPEETKNVADLFPEVVERLKKDLWLHKQDETSPHVDPNHCEGFQGMDAETESQLKALGYLN